MSEAAAFLLARLNEQDRADWHELGCPATHQYTGPCGCAVPAWVEADVAAKRRAAEQLSRWVGQRRLVLDTIRNFPDRKVPDFDRERVPALSARIVVLHEAVADLCTPWAGHPDYRTDWKD